MVQRAEQNRGPDDALELGYHPDSVCHTFSDLFYQQHGCSLLHTCPKDLAAVLNVRSIDCEPLDPAPALAAVPSALPVHQLGARGTGPRVRFRNHVDDQGNPLCNKCGSPDHLARDCTATLPPSNPVSQLLAAYDDEDMTLEEFAVHMIQRSDFQ
jgi:hypothetical protein